MAAKAVASISRLVCNRTEYMDLIAPSLEGSDLKDMYQKAARTWKQALWAIPYGVEVDVINPIVSQIMESSLPGDLKNDLAKCIHSQIECESEPAAPPVVADMPVPAVAAAEHIASPPAGGMPLMRRASTAMVLIPDFEIHKFFRRQDWEYLDGPATLYQKMVYTAIFLRSLKLPKIKEKIKARIVSLVISIAGKMTTQPSVTESLNELRRFKIIMLKYELADKTTCELPRMPYDPSDLKTICFDTWSTLYNGVPPEPDRFAPEHLVIAYSNDHCRSTKLDRSVEEATEPIQPSGKRMAIATRGQMNQLQNLIPNLSFLAQQFQRPAPDQNIQLPGLKFVGGAGTGAGGEQRVAGPCNGVGGANSGLPGSKMEFSPESNAESDVAADGADAHPAPSEAPKKVAVVRATDKKQTTTIDEMTKAIVTKIGGAAAPKAKNKASPKPSVKKESDKSSVKKQSVKSSVKRIRQGSNKQASKGIKQVIEEL